MKLYQHRSYVAALKNASHLPGMYVDEDKKGFSFRNAGDCMSLDGIPYIGEYSKGSKNIYVATGFNKWGMTSSMTAGMLLADLILEKKNECETLFSPSRPMFTPQLAINAAESLMGLLSFSKRRCPHLGCALKWNKEERSWDCPCHGSRFAESGALLDNPANDNLRKNIGKI